MQPFLHYKENPSWLAVQPLHNTVIVLDEQPERAVMDDKLGLKKDEEEIPKTRIHISALQVPVVYESVLETVPGLHLRPPILPGEVMNDGLFPRPPKKGYDLIFHIGVAGRGALRVEKVGHKLGYQMKDAHGKLAPLVESPVQEFGRNRDGFLGAVNMEMLAMDMVETHTAGEGAPRLNRGFGAGYEKFPEELYTDVDLTALVQDLKRQGVEVSLHIGFRSETERPHIANLHIYGRRALSLRLYLLLFPGRVETECVRERTRLFIRKRKTDPSFIDALSSSKSAAQHCRGY